MGAQWGLSVWSGGGISESGYPFFLGLPIYSSTEIVDKNVERNINTFIKKGFLISDFLSGVLFNMNNLLTNL